MSESLDEPDLDQILIKAYNMGMSKYDITTLQLDKKYALCLLKLGPSVEPSDYTNIEDSIKGLPGITGANILIHHKTRSTIPAGTNLVAVTEFKLRLDPV